MASWARCRRRRPLRQLLFSVRLRGGLRNPIQGKLHRHLVTIIWPHLGSLMWPDPDPRRPLRYRRPRQERQIRRKKLSLLVRDVGRERFAATVLSRHAAAVSRRGWSASRWIGPGTTTCLEGELGPQSEPPSRCAFVALEGRVEASPGDHCIANISTAMSSSSRTGSSGSKIS